MSLTMPSFAYTQHMEADGKISTEYDGIYLDNNNIYYTEEASGPSYLNKIVFSKEDINSISEISEKYLLPIEVVDGLKMALSTINTNETVSLFVPYSTVATRGGGEGWGGEYDYIYQGIRFRLKNYFIYLDTVSVPTEIASNSAARVAASLITDLAILAGTTLLGEVSVAAGIGASLLQIFINQFADFPVEGATKDFLTAQVDFSATQKYTYVLDGSNWECRMKTSQTILNSVRFYYFEFEPKNEFVVIINCAKAFVSPNYYNADLVAVTTNTMLADDPITLDIHGTVFSLE